MPPTSAPAAPATPTAPGASTPQRTWPTRRWWLIALALFAGNYVLVSFILPPSSTQRVAIPYTVFKQQADASNVAAITATADQIQGRLKQAISYTPPTTGQAVQVTAFATVQPTFSDPGLETLLEQQGVVVNATSLDQTTPWWLNLLLGFGPTILLIVGFVWLTNRAGQAAGGGLFGIGRSRAKRYDEAQGESKRTTFADVAGIDEAKGELGEIVDFLRDPNKYTRLGGSVPKGVLLVGPPGTGKTLLARAVCGETKVPFFSMGASEFVEMVVGVGAARVRDLFRQARQAAPAIIFIDELDAIGRARGGAG